MKYVYKERVRCSVCNKIDEGYQLEIKILFFTIRRGICESCISKMFRGLHKTLNL